MRIVLDPNGNKLFRIMLSHCALEGVTFQANEVDQAAQWLISNRDSFKGWVVNNVMESSPVSEVWTASVSFFKPRGNGQEDQTKQVPFQVSLVNPPKVRKLADLTLEEKVEAILKALAKHRIEIEVK